MHCFIQRVIKPWCCDVKYAQAKAQEVSCPNRGELSVTQSSAREKKKNKGPEARTTITAPKTPQHNGVA